MNTAKIKIKSDYTKAEAAVATKEILAILPKGFRPQHEWCSYGTPEIFYNLRFIKKIAPKHYVTLYLGRDGWYCTYPYSLDLNNEISDMLKRYPTPNAAINAAILKITDHRDKLNHLIGQLFKSP